MTLLNISNLHKTNNTQLISIINKLFNNFIFIIILITINTIFKNYIKIYFLNFFYINP